MPIPHPPPIGSGLDLQTLDWRPRNTVWELTLACNLSCRHCGSRAGRARDREMDTRECLDVVAQLVDLGGELLTLSGGEPLIRHDWEAVAREGVRRGLVVNLVTNGTLVDDRVAGRLVDAGLSNVGVSIDGPEAVHDTIRGPGTFRAAVRGIGRLREAGMPVAVLVTVHRLNLPWLEWVCRQASDLGASQVRFQLGKPMGALKDRQDWVIAPRQLPGLVDRLVHLREASDIEVAVGDSIGYCTEADRSLRGWGWRGRPEAWHGCQAGMQALGIESDGGVKGCLSLQARSGPDDPFREGSLREAPLAHWWFRPGAFPYNRGQGARDLTGACRSCRHGARCRGGAKCVAAAFTGTLAENPYCDWRVRSLDGRPSLREALIRSARAAVAATMVAAFPGCEPSAGGDLGRDVPGETLPGDPGMADVPDPGTVGEVLDPGMPDPGTVAEVSDPGMPDIATGEVSGDAPGPVDPGAADPSPERDAIDCAAVCCTCEYGVIPDEVWKACCEGPADVPAADVPGTDVPIADLGPGDTAEPDCSPLPCLSTPESIPADLRARCCDEPCTPPPCCECDYGMPPPPQCCR